MENVNNQMSNSRIIAEQGYGHVIVTVVRIVLMFYIEESFEYGKFSIVSLP